MFVGLLVAKHLSGQFDQEKGYWILLAFEAFKFLL